MSIHQSPAPKDILHQEDKGVRTARGVLSRLFRTILFEQGIDGPRWEMLMQRILDDPRNPAPRNSKDRSSLKGNLNKALKAPRMTWKTFEKALRLLAPESVRFEVHLKWFNGKTTIHNVTQELGGFRVEDYLEDETDTPLLDSLLTEVPEPPHFQTTDLPTTPTDDMSLEERTHAISEAFLDIMRTMSTGHRDTPCQPPNTESMTTESPTATSTVSAKQS